jgi:Ca2+-binding RTX toxin-like protein
MSYNTVSNQGLSYSLLDMYTLVKMYGASTKTDGVNYNFIKSNNYNQSWTGNNYNIDIGDVVSNGYGGNYVSPTHNTVYGTKGVDTLNLSSMVDGAYGITYDGNKHSVYYNTSQTSNSYNITSLTYTNGVTTASDNVINEKLANITVAPADNVVFFTLENLVTTDAADTVTIGGTFTNYNLMNGNDSITGFKNGVTVNGGAGVDTLILNGKYTYSNGVVTSGTESMTVTNVEKLVINGVTTTVDTTSDPAQSLATVASVLVSNSPVVLADTVKPTVISYTPTSSNAACATDITVTFSEAVKITGTVTLTKNGVLVESFDSSKIVMNGNTITLNPTKDLDYNTAYVISVNDGAVTDLAGNVISAAGYSFTTERDTVKPTAVITLAPKTNADEPVNMTIKFSEAVNGFTIDDLVVTGGTVSNLTTTDNINYTVKFTAKAGATIATVDLAANKYTDLSGNANDTSVSVSTTVSTPIKDMLFNATSKTETFTGGLGNDTVSYSGILYQGVTVDLSKTTSQYTMGSGYDKLVSIENLVGTSYNDVLKGNSDDNKLSGGNGTDYLYGLDGNDILAGGEGADYLYGGLGSDTFLFNTRVMYGQSDTIFDFKTGEDKLAFSPQFYTSLSNLNPDNFIVNKTGKAMDSNDYLIYNSTNGRLYYDKDGAGGQTEVQIALIANKADLSYTDIILG